MMASWKKTWVIMAALSAAYFLGRFFAQLPSPLASIGESHSIHEAPSSEHLTNSKHDESMRRLREENDSLRREIDGKQRLESRTVDHSSVVSAEGDKSADRHSPGQTQDEGEATMEIDEAWIDPAKADSLPTNAHGGLETLEDIKHELKAMPTGTTADWPEPKRRSFLSRMTLGDPLKTIDQMSRVDTDRDRYLSAFYGRYRGPIRFMTKRKVGHIRLDIREYDAEQAQRWLVLIEVTDGGANKSRTTGGLDMLRSLDPKSPGYAIRSSETSFLQLFYREAERRFIGNYYEKKNSSTYIRLGTVELNRVQDLP